MTRSGPNIPEAQRKTVAVKLRLAPDVATLLDVLCQDANDSERGAYVTRLILRAAHSAGLR